MRRQLAEAEEELVEFRRHTAELQAEAVDTIVGGGEVSELAEGVSELQQEIHDLVEVEKAARSTIWAASLCLSPGRTPSRYPALPQLATGTPSGEKG